MEQLYLEKKAFIPSDTVNITEINHNRILMLKEENGSFQIMFDEKPLIVEIKAAEAVITRRPFRNKFLKVESEVSDKSYI